MSFVKTRIYQVSFKDNIHTLSERNLRLKKSWAERFSWSVHPKINEERFAVLYSGNPATRPNTPVNVIVGMESLAEACALMMRLTGQTKRMDSRWCRLAAGR